MNILDMYNLYLAGNKKLIYYLLQTVIECIPEEYREKYYKQIECIDKIQWVLDVEIDLFLEKSSYCKKNLIDEWREEKIISELLIKDKNAKKYRIKIFAVNGHVFSMESSLPFRYLKLRDIVDIQVICGEEK